MAQNLSAEILTIGNEVISGLIQDSNSRKLAAQLNDIGIWVTRMTSVGDDADAIKDDLDRILSRAKILIITGGLGATHDDITKKVLTEYFGTSLVPNERVREMVTALCAKRGRAPTDILLTQCDVPESATILYNEKGTAPGLLFERDGRRVYALPGVPLEMEHLLETWVVPDLAKISPSKIRHRLINTTGIAESALWDKMGSAEELEQGVRVASLPSYLGVRIRLSAFGQDDEVLTQNLDRAEGTLRKKLDSFVFSVDDETMEGCVGRLLREKGFKLATAESCTGGLISRRLTEVAGSSEYFLEGAVTYSNSAKSNRLGVPAELIEAYGAVSKPVALAMAKGSRQASDADIAVSVTGIAGPEGGTEDKPVGLTFIAVSDKDGEHCQRFLFHQDRARNRERAAQAALNMVRLRLMGCLDG